MKGTWQTTGGGGGGAGTALGLLVVAVVAVAILGPVVRAAVSLLETVLVVAAVLFGLLVLAGATFAVWRLRHRSPSPAAVPWRPEVPSSAAYPLPAPPHRALEASRELHLHFHGVAAEDVAAILRDQP